MHEYCFDGGGEGEVGAVATVRAMGAEGWVGCGWCGKGVWVRDCGEGERGTSTAKDGVERECSYDLDLRWAKVEAAVQRVGGRW